MAKIYLRKQRTPQGICSGCYFFDKKVESCAVKYKCAYPHDVILKRISERTAKKLLKSGKCKIVNNPPM